MSEVGSTLDDEPYVVDSPTVNDRDAEPQESDSSTDDDDDEEVSVKRKFDQILSILRDKGQLNLSLFDHNAGYLGQKTSGDNDHTLLHLLVEDAKDKVIEKYKPLVKLLIERHPHLMKEKDSNEKTPLYIAISKKRDKLVRFLCETYKDIDSILKTPCYHSENCLHVAIRRNVAPKLALFLIERAGEKTLCAKDDKGNTPLHLAVEYERCTDAQMAIVKALVERSDKAMDERTNAPYQFSPFLYHEHTRTLAKRAEEAQLLVREKEKEIGQEKKKSELLTAAAKESNRYTPRAEGHLKDGIHLPSSDAGKAELTPRENAETKSAWANYRSTRGETGRGDRNPGYVKPKAEALEVPPKPLTRTGTSSEAKPVPPNEKKPKKRTKEEAKVTPESASAIENYLKLHCLRTRLHDDAVEFLYGRTQENQIYFDLYESPSLKISEERIEEGLAHLKFEEVLQYVALPSMQLEKRPIIQKAGRKIPKPDGRGRSDMVFLFNFLRNKRVKRIIRVIVDDTLEPAHSDESIEKALGGLKVEIWDWRKIDLCTETIVTAAPEVREVSLYWSGNNAVLRGWSEVGGLNMLTRLKKVHLHYGQGLETTKRTQNNIRDFQRRLKLLRPDVEVDIVAEKRPEKTELNGEAIDTAQQEHVEHRHKWLTCMDDYADFIQNVEPPLPIQEPIMIALIDDGVDINEQSLHAKIIGGRSFCQRDRFQNLSKPYYVTSGGHGTVMASLICRVCPNAQLFVVKLDDYMGENSKRQITAKSAAKAVRAAVDKKVHIISMSWTIERTAHNAEDIQDLESSIEAAARAGILMFCAANDQGIARDNSFPAACGGTKHLFKIGAAEASGAVWKWVGDPADVDFIFPGHNVVKDRPNDVQSALERCKTLTGSSVATAIASGLAALILYCVQLGALNTQAQAQQSGLGANSVTMADFKAIKGYERMKEAFLAIGTSQASGNKYIEVWDVFGPAAKKAERVGREGRIEIVTEVAGRLKTRKTFE
ncbi:hypothetical protein BGZ60DRAFT_532842 [Tricladium varicosporioides]|nr:hypothetical protein BGZ60DRAFT_532842 [Hymenoscyphus varicosporioides]